ncbi:GrpE nucleotide exchange factor, partial [Sistotremastrum suecicum HHB10207 ss-3]
EDSSSDDKPVSEADAPLQECTTKLAAKEAEVVDLTGRLRYAQADYQNLQRISQREKEQTRDFAISRFASDLLETVDVLTLALRSVPSSSLSPADSPLPSSSSSSAANEKSTLAHLTELHQGVSLTHKQLLSTLAKYGVRQFDPTGDKFDPNLHEALYAAPIPGKEPGSVVECQKFGYMIKDRVLRAAQVGVVQE